jgi:hypothetical protein
VREQSGGFSRAGTQQLLRGDRQTKINTTQQDPESPWLSGGIARQFPRTKLEKRIREEEDKLVFLFLVSVGATQFLECNQNG